MVVWLACMRGERVCVGGVVTDGRMMLCWYLWVAGVLRWLGMRWLARCLSWCERSSVVWCGEYGGAEDRCWLLVASDAGWE